MIQRVASTVARFIGWSINPVCIHVVFDPKQPGDRFNHRGRCLCSRPAARGYLYRDPAIDAS